MLIFGAERLSFLVLSFVLGKRLVIAFRTWLINAIADYSIWCLVPHVKGPALILLATSSTMLTFQLRAFSNSVEAVLLALALTLWKQVHDGCKVRVLGIVVAAMGWLT